MDNSCGETQRLVRSIKGARFEEVETLMRRGVSPNGTTPDGRTPLLVAAETGQVGMIEVLVAYGADVNSGARTGFTPLFAAALQGHLRATIALLAVGANPLAGPHGRTISAVLPATTPAELHDILQLAEVDWLKKQP